MSTPSDSPAIGRALPFFSTEAARQNNPSPSPNPDTDATGASPDESGDVPTFASTMDNAFSAADGEAEVAEQTQPQTQSAADEGTSAEGLGRGGRKNGAMKWNGLELRALLRAMDSHSVLDPTLSDSPDSHTRMWLAVVDDVNRWNKINNVRKNGKVAERTVESCESKWRKDLYPKIKEGMKASEIATGPAEENEEQELTDIMERLKEQWEQGLAAQQEKREQKRKVKDPKSVKSLEARSKATSSDKPAASTSGDGPDDLASDDDDPATEEPAVKRRRGPAGRG